MSVPSPDTDRQGRNLELMRRGDEAFNARDRAGMKAVHAADMVAHIVGSGTIEGEAAHAEAMQAMFRAFPDVRVHNDPYRVQVASDDWITVITRTTGTFTGEMVQPDGTVVPGTGKAFDLDFTTTARWRGDELVEEYVFWDTAAMAQQIGLTG